MAAEEPVPPSVGEKTWDAFLTAVATSLYNTIYTGASEPANTSSDVEVGESKHKVTANYTYPKFNSGNVPTIDAIKSNIIKSIGFDETMLSNSIIGEKTAVASIVTLIGHYVVDTFFPAYHKAGTSTSGAEITTLGSFSWSNDEISAADMSTILNSMATAIGDAMSGTVTQAVTSATWSSC